MLLLVPSMKTAGARRAPASAGIEQWPIRATVRSRGWARGELRGRKLAARHGSCSVAQHFHTPGAHRQMSAASTLSNLRRR
jgi:hypothetical protein